MTGNMFEMDAIGATVLGGTALAGGRGRVTGSIIGAFVIVFLADGMVMMGVSDFWQMVIKGWLSSPPSSSTSSSRNCRTKSS